MRMMYWFTNDVLNVDNDMIFYSASVNENFTAAFSNNTLTIAPTPNWSGSGYLTIYAFDGEYISDQTFLLTVLPVNDYPVRNFFKIIRLMKMSLWMLFYLDQILIVKY